LRRYDARVHARRLRIISLPAISALALLAACGDDSGGGGASVTSDSRAAGGGATTPAPVEGPLTMPADVAEMLAPEPATALAGLGFPAGWVLPAAADDIVGVTVRYSQGDDTYATFATSYEVAGDDPQVVLDEWRVRFAEALGVEVDKYSVSVSSISGEAWLVSSIGDVEPDRPEVEIEIAKLAEADRPLVLTVKYRTIDRTFPQVVYPTSIDPTLPSVDGCTIRRVDVELDPSADVTEAPEPAAYRLWWEGDCPAATFADAADWAAGHGFDADPSSNGFGHEATLADGTVVSLNVSKRDDGSLFMSIVVEQPVA